MRTAPLALALTIGMPTFANAAEPPVLAERLKAILDLEDARVPGGGELLTWSRRPEAVAVRRRALRALARLQDPDVAPALWAALETDSDAIAQGEAAFGLGLLPGLDMARLRKAYEKGRARGPAGRRATRAVIEAIGRQGGPDDVPLLVGGLSSPDARLAYIALGLVARRQSGRLEGVPDTVLVSGMAGARTSEARFGLAYLLMRVSGWEEGRVLPLARPLLSDADPEVRAMACRALAGRPAAVTLMAERAADDLDPRVRVEAIRALGKSKAKAALAALVEAAAAAARAPASLAGPALHPWIECLETALSLPDHPETISAARQVLEAAGPSSASHPPGVALGLSHLRCRAAALVDRADHGLRHLPTCASPELPVFVRETLTAPVLATLPEAGRELSVEAFLAAASPAGRAAFFAAIEVDSPPAFRARVLAGLTATDPAELAEAAGAAARLDERVRASAPLSEALRRVLAAGDVETTLSILDAVAKLEVSAAGPAVLDATRSAQPALRKAALAAAKALKLKPADGGPSALAPSPLEPLPAPRSAHVLTSKGELVIDFVGEEAPRTVANFARLARRGFYDGQLFHRVVPDFVAQGGDPRGDGWGGPGYSLRCELNHESYVRGAVGMALAGQDTGGSQFFITHTGHPHLDGGYTVFGHLRSGFETLDALAVGDRILKVTIESFIP